MEWISVNDRLPTVKKVKDRYATYKSSDYVLALCENKMFSIVQYEIDDDGAAFWTRDDGSADRITHWMPLPDPPKE